MATKKHNDVAARTKDISKLDAIVADGMLSAGATEYNTREAVFAMYIGSTHGKKTYDVALSEQKAKKVVAGAVDRAAKN